MKISNSVKSQTTVFFPFLPSSFSPVCTFLVTSPPLKTRRWNNITGFLPTFHKFMFEKKEPQIFNEAYRVSKLNLQWVGMSAILMVFKSKSNYFGRFSNTDRASVKPIKKWKIALKYYSVIQYHPIKRLLGDTL